jgi:23S rRNA-/tRNA-specific pseudouridylate synthase
MAAPQSSRAEDAPVGPFRSSAEAQVFRFVHEGEAGPLHAYLLARYSHGRDERWARSFFPERVRLNGQPADESTWVRPGDEVSYLHLRAEEPPPPALGPPLYEDEWVLALEKPDRIPVNPSGVYYFTSLAILAREVFANPELTPIHRLDLETGGPVLFARRSAHLKAFHRLFQRQAIHKRYRALVHGRFPAGLTRIAGRIEPAVGSRIHTKLRLVPLEDPLPEDTGGEPALLSPGVSLTRVVAVRPLGSYSEVVLEPVTGKTNQLRVHLAHVGHPIVGDKKYHPDESVFLDWMVHRDFERLRDRLLLPRQALHCESLRFTHPFTGRTVEVASDPAVWADKIAPLVGPLREGATGDP